jgi:hypothetical protein
MIGFDELFQPVVRNLHVLKMGNGKDIKNQTGRGRKFSA